VGGHNGIMPPEHSFASVEQKNVVLTAMKRAESGSGLVIRFYEWAGKGGTVTLKIPSGATDATLVNLMEKPEGEAIRVNGNLVTVPVIPFQIQTVRLNYKSSPAK
jgi:alpha-mannosidase